ncbi:hypothetical protein HID58_095532, partial [Brassica napus]
IFMTTICWGPKSNLVKLEYLDLSNNKLKGEIPVLENHGKVSDLNKFKCWSLVQILFEDHYLIGSETVLFLDMSNNSFSGSIPQCLSNTISANYDTTTSMEFFIQTCFSTTILSSVDSAKPVGRRTSKSLIKHYFRILNVKSKESKTHFHLGGFFAVIKCHDPPRKRIIRALVLSSCLRWVSDNGFTNDIPQSLANLTILEALDLSLNQLSGLIPQDLGSLSFLSIINFSHNNLQRPIPRNSTVSKIYVEKIHVPNPTPQESEDLSEPKEQVISWISAGIAYGPGVFCGVVIGHRFSPRIHNWFM